MAYPDIKLGSSFDAKGFKQAETASAKLGKTIKNFVKNYWLVVIAHNCHNRARKIGAYFFDNFIRFLRIIMR